MAVRGNRSPRRPWDLAVPAHGLDAVRFLAALAPICCGMAAHAGELAPGVAAPPFTLSSGGGHKLTLDALAGKVVVLFYESRDQVKTNRLLKNELERLYRDQPRSVRDGIVAVPVIDCSAAVFPLTLLWRRALREASRREGVRVYGDWDGRMLARYGLTAGDSNFLLIDPSGRIRYRAHGKIAENAVAEIEKLVLRLARQEAAAPRGAVPKKTAVPPLGSGRAASLSPP